MAKSNTEIVLNKEKALESFFGAYACNIEGSMPQMTKIELLEHLGSYSPEHGDGEPDNIEDPHNYVPDDIFVGCASAMTGIPEHEFLFYAVKHFGHG